jgi:DNA polymerase
VNKALVANMIDQLPVEDVINSCIYLKDFQKIVKVSNKYICGWHNGHTLTDKTFRVFASTNQHDGYIGKQKTEGATIEKFANTPEHCFIENGDINNAPVPDKLDRQYYITLAKERLKQFGVN